MLHFVQHEKFLNNVIPSHFHGWLEETVISEGPSLASPERRTRFSRRRNRLGSAGQVPDHCHSKERGDEESRSLQGEQFSPKNEMLHFVQHDKFMNNVIPSPFHGFLKMTFIGAKPFPHSSLPGMN